MPTFNSNNFATFTRLRLSWMLISSRFASKSRAETRHFITSNKISAAWAIFDFTIEAVRINIKQLISENALSKFLNSLINWEHKCINYYKQQYFNTTTLSRKAGAVQQCDSMPHLSQTVPGRLKFYKTRKTMTTTRLRVILSTPLISIAFSIRVIYEILVLFHNCHGYELHFILH